MKRYIISIISVLLSLQASAEKIQGTLSLTKPSMDAVCIYDTEAKTATLGNGYTTCIKTTCQGEVEIPGAVTYQGVAYKVAVGQFAFRLCEEVTKVTVGEGVEHIGDFAFVGCAKMTEIVLPSTLKTIGAGAFCNMKNLFTIRCNATTAPTWQWNDVFSPLGTKESMHKKSLSSKLFVPKGSVESYMTTKFDGTSTGTLTKANEKVGWQEAFSNIIDDLNKGYEINSVEQLMAFRDAVNNGTVSSFKTTNFILTADLDMAAADGWESIGTLSNKFTGSFDGNGHVIKNLHVSGNEPNMGLFGYVENATIYNLHLIDPVVNSTKYAGALVGSGQNMYVKDILVTSNITDDASYTITSDASPAGGIVGYAKDATIERCMFQGKVKSPENCGGIVGKVEGHGNIADCMVNCEVKNTKTGDNIEVPGTGGIVGSADAVYIERCFAKAYLYYSVNNPKTRPGIVAGDTYSDTNASSIQNCAYWKTIWDYSLLNNSKLECTTKDNVGYDQIKDMIQSYTQPVLGSQNWFYFTGAYLDNPVPATLKDMFLANIVDKKDNASGFVYRMAGEGNSSYVMVGYTGDASEITIPATFNGKNVIGIEAEVFMDNATLTKVLFESPSHITSIGDRAFYNCNGLTAIDLPDAVLYVGVDAFAHCDELTSFNIGQGLNEVKGNILAYCPKLTTLTATRGNNNHFKCVDNVLLHCPATGLGLDSYVIVCAAGKKGNYVVPIEELENYIHFRDNCFAGCTELTGITLPARKNENTGCAYSLGKGMFDGAYNLRYIDMSDITTVNQTIYNVDRSDEKNPFYGLSDYTIVYLPAGHTTASGEPNVVIGGTAYRLELDEEWDFEPKVSTITTTDGVGFNRSIDPLIVENTSKTDEQITVVEDGTEHIVDIYNGTFEYTDAGYTCYLPYSIDLSEEENIKVYKPTSVGPYTGGSEDPLNGKTVITFTEVESKKMDALTPYFLVLSGDLSVYLDTHDPVTINCDVENLWQLGDYEFKGTLVNIPNATLYDANKPAYLLQSDGNWHKVPQGQNNAYVRPYRAFFQAVSATNANALTAIFKGDDIVTGIDTAVGVENNTIIRTCDNDGSERYYDINGRRLNGKPQKGLYIHNGKKIYAE